MENLRVLDLAGSKLRELWRHGYQAPIQLRELNVCAPLSHLHKSIGKLKYLEKIVVDFIDSGLESLPEEFCQLHSLKYLQLERCSKMRSLPDSFGDLTSLQHMHLSHADSLQMLPSSFGNLKSLKKLFLSSCPKLKSLPDSVGLMSKMTVLSLRSTHIQTLPQNLQEMKNLDILEVEGCPLRHLIRLDYLQLSKIKIRKCNDLVEVGALPSTLITLNLSYCHALRKIGEFSGLAKLQHLDIMDCYALEELPNLQTLTCLAVINIVSCDSLKNIKGLAQVAKLRILNIGGCSNITRLPSIKNLKSLEVLRAWECGNLKTIRGLELLQNLRILDVHQSHNLVELSGIQPLKSLEEINVSGCPRLEGRPEYLIQTE